MVRFHPWPIMQACAKYIAAVIVGIIAGTLGYATLWGRPDEISVANEKVGLLCCVMACALLGTACLYLDAETIRNDPKLANLRHVRYRLAGLSALGTLSWTAATLTVLFIALWRAATLVD